MEFTQPSIPTTVQFSWWDKFRNSVTVSQLPSPSSGLSANFNKLKAIVESDIRTSSVPMDVGHLPLLARLSGTLCPRTCRIRMFLRRVTGSHSHWRRFYFRSTSVFSALEVFFTRMHYINLHLTLTDIWHWHIALELKIIGKGYVLFTRATLC